MKYLLLSILLSNTALANDWHRSSDRTKTYLSPGQCINIDNEVVCADDVSNRRVSNRPLRVEKISIHCDLGRYVDESALNFWALLQVTTTNDGESKKIVLKTFPHFEGKKCKKEANLQNDLQYEG